MLLKIMKTATVLLFMFGLTSNAVGVTKLSGDAPNFTLKSNKESNIKLSELRGQVVMINFWASWCGPCRQEMPELEKLFSKYEKLGFTILGVNVEEDNTEAMKIVKEDNLTFPILFDDENKVSQLYKVTAMPTTVMIGRDGTLRYQHRAYKPGDEKIYKKWVKELVRE